MVKSSNIGAAHIGMMVGAERQQALFSKLGLLDRLAGGAQRGGAHGAAPAGSAGPISRP